MQKKYGSCTLRDAVMGVRVKRRRRRYGEDIEIEMGLVQRKVLPS